MCDGSGDVETTRKEEAVNDEAMAFEMERAEVALVEKFDLHATSAACVVAALVDLGWAPAGVAQSVRIVSLETELREIGKTFRVLEREFAERAPLDAMCGDAAARCEAVASAGLPTRNGARRPRPTRPDPGMPEKAGIDPPPWRG